MPIKTHSEAEALIAWWLYSKKGSIRSLATRLGVSHQTIYYWKNAKLDIPGRYRKKVIELGFDVPLYPK